VNEYSKTLMCEISSDAEDEVPAFAGMTNAKDTEGR